MKTLVIGQKDIFERELAGAKLLAQELFDKLMPSVKVYEKDGSLCVYDSSVTLDPIVFEKKTIYGKENCCGWQVNCWQDGFGVSDGPPNFYSIAVKNFVRAAFNCELNRLWRLL